MESLAARNLAGMAISVHPIRRCWRKKRLRNEMGFAINAHGPTSFRVRCCGGGSGLALPVRKDFADEEDYVKAGGSELLFVQMQQNKSMDHQTKLSDKVYKFPTFSFPAVVSILYLHLCILFFHDDFMPASVVRVGWLFS